MNAKYFVLAIRVLFWDKEDVVHDVDDDEIDCE